MTLPQTPLHQLILSLGSNMGDRYENLLAGLRFLCSQGFRLVHCSGVYETDPVGYTAQPPFLNMVAHMETDKGPQAALEVCQGAEQARLRTRTIRWGPRTLDVDILLFDDLTLDTPTLTIPHPRMGSRAFVLGPLAEMDAGILEKWGFTPCDDAIVLRIQASDVKQRLGF